MPLVKVFFFRKYDAFLKLPKKCAKKKLSWTRNFEIASVLCKQQRFYRVWINEINIPTLKHLSCLHRTEAISKSLVQDSFFGTFFGQFEKCIILPEKKRPLASTKKEKKVGKTS